MKRIFTFLLALMMALVLAVPTFAEETTYSITITNAATGHTYEAYQIFAGDLHEKVLSNIVWGSGVSEAGQTALGNAAEKAASLATRDDAHAFAKAVAKPMPPLLLSISINCSACSFPLALRLPNVDN